MSFVLRQSTDSQEIMFRLVDATDAKTGETGLTIANTDIKIWKKGATALTNKNSGGATEVGSGWYYAVLDATDTNTAGGGFIYIDIAGCAYWERSMLIYPATIYDSLIAASDSLTVDLTTAAVDDIWNEDVTAHTTANTAGENLNVINDMLTGKKTVSGTTMTHYKQDGTTARKTFTLDSATTPTSRTPA